jgi:hypothetical protein
MSEYVRMVCHSNDETPEMEPLAVHDLNLYNIL